MSRDLLTARRIRSASAPGAYKDGGGLRLVVTVRGTQRWELWISIKGRKRQLGLGVYPQVSLREARDKADEIRRAARSGIDLRMQRLQAHAQTITFREAFDTCFDLKRQQLSNAKHLRQWQSTMETYVFPVFGDLAIANITSSQVIEVLKPIWYHKPETAKRVLQRIEAVFKSAIIRGTREKASPCVGVVQELRTGHRDVQHHPSLPWRDVPDFIRMLQRPARGRWPTTRLAFEFLILTATRSGETRGATWAEFDLEGAIWNIGKERMKSRRDHRVPLSKRCLTILRLARALNPDGTLVFEGTKRARPLSDMTFTKLLRDAGLGEIATAHGFRSTFKTWCAEVGNVPDDMSEAALAHTIRDRVKAAYLRTDFLEERRPHMEAWAAHCLAEPISSSGRKPHIAVADQSARLPLGKPKSRQLSAELLLR